MAAARPRVPAFSRGQGLRCMVDLPDTIVALPADAEVVLATGPLDGALPVAAAVLLAVP